MTSYKIHTLDDLLIRFISQNCLTCKGEEAINCLSRSPARPLGVEVANLPSMDPVTDPGLLGGVAKLGLLG